MRKLKLTILSSVVMLLAAFSASGGDNWYHYEQGMRMLKIKQYEQCYRELNYYLQHPEMHRQMFGVAHFGLGLMYESSGNLAKAIAEYNLAIETDDHPEVRVSANSYNNIGAIYFRTKEYGEAARIYLKLIEINPKSGRAHYFLGLSYLRMNEIEKAEKEASEAKALGYTSSALFEGLAEKKNPQEKNVEDSNRESDKKISSKNEKNKAEK